MKRAYGIFVVLIILVSNNAYAKIVTSQGNRYFQIGNNSFVVQPNGSIDESDAKAIVKILNRYYETNKSILNPNRDNRKSNLTVPIAAEVYEDIHIVYKGPLLGEIYRLCLLAHVEYIIDAVNYYNNYSSNIRASSLRVECPWPNRSTCFAKGKIIHVNNTFDVIFKSFEKRTIGESHAKDVVRNRSNSAKYAFRESYSTVLDHTLSKIYDNASIRGSWGVVEIALPEILRTLQQYFGKYDDFNSNPRMVADVFMKYIKNPKVKANIASMAPHIRERKKREKRSRLASSYGRIIYRDNRYIVYDNATLLDLRSNLMWSTEESGGDGISWTDAKGYCENYRGGGYTDWRMPTLNELLSLYYDTKKYRKHIKLSVEQWTSVTRDTKALGVRVAYMSKNTYWSRKSNRYKMHVLPVRNVK